MCHVKRKWRALAEAHAKLPSAMELPSTSFRLDPQLNSGDSERGAAKPNHWTRPNYFRSDGVFFRNSLPQLFPHEGLAEARRHGEGRMGHQSLP
jgi:hypothetical protein